MAGCAALMLVASASGDSHANDKTPNADPMFRLLELGGRKVRWTVPPSGIPAKISYAFVTAPVQFDGARNCDAMLPPAAAIAPSGISFEDFRRETRAAFATWEQAANITFVETSNVGDAGILIGADAKARGRAFTNVALRDEEATHKNIRGLGAIKQSLICLNPRRPWKVGFDGNLNVYDVRFTLTHEIGHAIGLDHPGPEGQLMSFRYVEKGRGLNSGDVAGAVALYGLRGAGPALGHETSSEASSARQPPTEPGGRAFGLGEPASD